MPDGQYRARHGRAAIEVVEASRQAAPKKPVDIVWGSVLVILPRMARAAFRLALIAIVAVGLLSALLIPILFGSA